MHIIYKRKFHGQEAGKKLSAKCEFLLFVVAQVRFLEAETRAQLRASQRSWPPPQGCPSGQEGAHKREQIERDWQRAKQELEQDDLLDFLADDPSAFLLSHLGQQGTLPMLPPAPAGLSGPGETLVPVSSSLLVRRSLCTTCRRTMQVAGGALRWCSHVQLAKRPVPATR